MKKIKNTKGFTLMEMLIVVAIIAILIAIAIPTFTAQLEKAREAADIANIRSAYSEAMVKYLNNDTNPSKETPEMTQTTAGWASLTWPEYLGTAVTPKKGDKVTVSINADGTVKCAMSGAAASTPAGG